MSDNSGEKSRNDFPVSSNDLTWMSNDKVPQIGATFKNPGATRNLRGVEANTNENKGTPCSYPPASIGVDEWGPAAGGTLEESY